jgi:hypothetical protein
MVCSFLVFFGIAVGRNLSAKSATHVLLFGNGYLRVSESSMFEKPMKFGKSTMMQNGAGC